MRQRRDFSNKNYESTRKVKMIVADHGFDELHVLLEKEVPEGVSIKEKLISVCHLTSSFLTTNPQLLRIMEIETSLLFWLSEDVQKQCMIKIEKLVTKVTEIISEGVSQGQIRADIPPKVLAYSLMGMLKFWTEYLIDDSDTMTKSELLVNLFYEGARPIH